MSNALGPSPRGARPALPGRISAAFTLVELLLVATLLAVLAAAAAPRINAAYRGLRFRGEIHRIVSLVNYASETAVRERAEVELVFVQGGARLVATGGGAGARALNPRSLAELGRTITMRSERQDLDEGSLGRVALFPDGSRTPDLWHVRDASGRERWIDVGRNFAALEVLDRRPTHEAP